MNVFLSRTVFALWCLVGSAAFAADQNAADQNASSIVKGAFDYWRGTSSRIVAEMTVHRADWERRMGFEGWTQGSDKSLVRFTAPAKDAGNASMTIDDTVWSYTPKLNKVIKIPPSMMNQSWMGSDFSYEDLSRDDEVVSDYTHRLIATEQNEGKKLFVIESIPREDSAIVWGKEIFRIREDHLLLGREFYDQEGKLVKRLTALKLAQLGGKLMAVELKMEKVEDPDEWTRVIHTDAEFDIKLPDSLFTVARLSTPSR